MMRVFGNVEVIFMVGIARFSLADTTKNISFCASLFHAAWRAAPMELEKIHGREAKEY